jgi:hypothetical protein
VADWREREVRNETSSRDINEFIEDANDASTDGTEQRYVCECSDSNCKATIGLTRVEYEDVRTFGTHFAIALDHENPELDVMVAEHDGFAVVRKLPGFPARLANDANPRVPSSTP